MRLELMTCWYWELDWYPFWLKSWMSNLPEIILCKDGKDTGYSSSKDATSRLWKGLIFFFWLQIRSAVFLWNPILIRKSISQFLHTGIYTDQLGSLECHESKVQFQQLSTVRSENCSTLADPWGEQRTGSEAWCGLGSAEWRCSTRCHWKRGPEGGDGGMYLWVQNKWHGNSKVN